MGDLWPFSGFPVQLHGAKKYDKTTLLIRHGDLVLDDEGQFEEVHGIYGLAQRLEESIHEVSSPRDTRLEDVPLNIVKALLEGSERDYLDSIYAVRSDGRIVEIEFSAVGYSDVYIQRLRLAQPGGQFPLQVPSRTTLVSIGGFEKSLLAHLQRDPRLLREISPRRFEEAVSSIIEEMGFDVELTRYSKDGGVDIFAKWRSSLVPCLLVIDCKQYSPARGGIGPDLVRMLYGLRKQHGANTAMLATTSYFTKGAKALRMQFGEDKIDLADYDRIKGWLDGVGWKPNPAGILVPSEAVADPPRLCIPGR